VELEYRKIETRLIIEKFPSKLIRKAVALPRIFPLWLQLSRVCRATEVEKPTIKLRWCGPRQRRTCVNEERETSSVINPCKICFLLWINLKIKCIYECRCYERLQTKTKEFTCLTWTGLVVELEHLEIKVRWTGEELATDINPTDTQHDTKIRSPKVCLLLIDTRTEDKNYTWVSVWWKTKN